MAKAKEDTATVLLETPEVVIESGFWHFGLLPATTQVLFPVQEPGKHEPTIKPIGSAYEVWENPSDDVIVGLDKGIHLFIAKARQYSGISVTGLHFSTTSQHVEMDDKATSRSIFPGGASWLDADQVKRVIHSCHRHIIRYPNGFARVDDPTQPTALINLDFGSRPKNMTEQEWSAYKVHNVVSEPFTYSAKTDRPVAEYVYLRKLEVGLDPRDVEAYRKNPNRFHAQWIGGVSRSFFESPPKSVSEMYPQEKLGG